MLKKNNKLIYENVYNNSFVDNIEEYIMLGLRKIRGISLEDFNTRFDSSFLSVFGEVVNKYKKNGLMDVVDKMVFITNEGMILMNLILKDFMGKL